MMIQIIVCACSAGKEENTLLHVYISPTRQLGSRQAPLIPHNPLTTQFTATKAAYRAHAHTRSLQVFGINNMECFLKRA